MGDSTMSHEVEQKFLEVEARLDELEAVGGATEEAPAKKSSRASKTTTATQAPFMEEEETS